MWWKWIFYSRGSARWSCQCIIRFKLPPTAVNCLGSELADSHGWGRSRHASTYLIQKLSWNQTFSVWWRYYGSVISDWLCFICLIWHTRGDKPVLPWLSRKNSGLLVRKNPLDTVERWFRAATSQYVYVRWIRQCIYNCDPKESWSAIL